MSRFRVTYTAYLPEPRINIQRHRSTDPESVRRCRELDDYTKRLDRQNYKLENLDDVCLSNLDKCNRYYNNSRKFLLIKFSPKFEEFLFKLNKKKKNCENHDWVRVYVKANVFYVRSRQMSIPIRLLNFIARDQRN